MTPSELRRLLPVEAGRVGGRSVPPDSVIAVAMCGGVDSSVSAALCAAAGVPTVGVTMRLWASEEMERGEGGCCSIDAVEDARRVCTRLGIPHYVLNMAQPFREAVVDDFLQEYGSGRTPNPCVRCNERIKFSELLRRTTGLGATHLATGHYAQVAEGADGRLALRRAEDRRKDQSYTLFRCDQPTLQRVVFPLGGFAKAEVRRMAMAVGLEVAAKPDSQELCFVGGLDHRTLLQERLGHELRDGPIFDTAGRQVGRHRGLALYTVGQRQGLGLQVRSPESSPQYVVRIEVERNALVVGPWSSLARSACTVERCHYQRPLPGGSVRGMAQLRAHGAPAAAEWRQVPGERASVRFAAPQMAVAPGQSLVLYDGDTVVAGGEIASG